MGCCKAVGELNKAVVNDDALTPFSPFAHKYTKNNNANEYEITFSVKGIHCAACIQLIEKAAYEFDFIIYARVNMSTARLHVIWRGHADNIDILADKIGALGYKLSTFQGDGDGKDEGEKKLLKCIAVSGFGMGNLMLLSVGLWSSSSETMGMSTRDFLHFISAIIALPIVIYAGMPFYKSAYKALQGKRTNMDVPISLAIILASGMSLFEAFNHGEHVYFDSALMLVFFLLIGRYLDLRAKGKARESVANLLDMFNGHATIIKNKEQRVIPIRDLREGMVALVATGEKIPADGVVIKGASEVDTSLITGETIPSPIGKNSAVFAGTINMVKPITIKISSAGENSLLSDIVKLVEVAENNKSKYVRLADYAASLYVPIVHTMGLVTFLLWAFVLDASWQVALLNAVAVLIITCPCALGLAVPIVQVLASSLLMRKGIFVKSGDALERLSRITDIIFDKTGTLTHGTPRLLKGHYNSDDLKLAASIARYSKHPLSKAIYKAYDGGDDSLYNFNDVQEIAGKGLMGKWQGKTIKLGARKWCGDISAPSTTHLELWLSDGTASPILFSFADILREDAGNTIAQFIQNHIHPIILSGDRGEVVADIANNIGISDYHANFSPVDKNEFLKNMDGRGKKTLMVGDGLNDAPSLACASVSMSPSSAMDISKKLADIVFQGDKLNSVFFTWKLAKYSTLLIKQNFALAVLYNILAVPLAVAGHVTPLVAAIAMSSSSLLVLGNSFRLVWKAK